MSESEKLDSCIRVVANRCRNLRKAIERAKTWERAAEDGQQLNDEQMKSVKSIEAKETLLLELQEILKKQTAIVQPQAAQDVTPISKRKAKAERAARAKEVQLEKESTSSSKSTGKTDQGRDNSVPEVPSQFQENTNDGAGNVSAGSSSDQGVQDAIHNDRSPEQEECEAPNTTDVKETGLKTTLTTSEEATSFTLHTDIEDMHKQMDAIQMQHAEHLNRDRKDTIRMTLNLFHVVDFLRQKGSREALLAFFDSPAGQRCSKRVDSLDLDLLCYFNVMLTSPNGNVPHNEAVDVSTAHCLEFLKGSVSPAFKGTSYSKLSEIATTIGSCPILTERGLQDEGRQGRGKRKNRSRGKPDVSSNGREPGHIVDNQATDIRLP